MRPVKPVATLESGAGPSGASKTQAVPASPAFLPQGAEKQTLSSALSWSVGIWKMHGPHGAWQQVQRGKEDGFACIDDAR